MRNVVVRRSCASRRNRHRKRNRDYDKYCRVYNLTGLPRSLLRSARRRGWMPGKPVRSRASSERAPAGSRCRPQAPPPAASSNVARGQCACQPAGPRLCMDRGKVCCRLGPNRPGTAEPSFACAGKSTSRSRPSPSPPAAVRRITPAALRPAQVGPRGRPAFLRPANPASSTVMMHGERHQAPHALRRVARQDRRSRRQSGDWDRRAASFAFGGCRNPQRPDTVMVGCRGGEFQLEAVLPAAAGSSRRDRINVI